MMCAMCLSDLIWDVTYDIADTMMLCNMWSMICQLWLWPIDNKHQTSNTVTSCVDRFCWVQWFDVLLPSNLQDLIQQSRSKFRILSLHFLQLLLFVSKSWQRVEHRNCTFSCSFLAFSAAALASANFNAACFFDSFALKVTFSQMEGCDEMEGYAIDVVTWYM